MPRGGLVVPGVDDVRVQRRTYPHTHDEYLIDDRCSFDVQYGGTLSVANNTWTTIPWGNNGTSLLQAAPGAHYSRYYSLTIPSAYWQMNVVLPSRHWLSMECEWAANATGYRAVALYQDGGLLQYWSAAASTGGGLTNQVIETFYGGTVNATRALTWMVYQNSGGALNLTWAEMSLALAHPVP